MAAQPAQSVAIERMMLTAPNVYRSKTWTAPVTVPSPLIVSGKATMAIRSSASNTRTTRDRIAERIAMPAMAKTFLMLRLGRVEQPFEFFVRLLLLVGGRRWQRSGRRERGRNRGCDELLELVVTRQIPGDARGRADATGFCRGPAGFLDDFEEKLFEIAPRVIHDRLAAEFRADGCQNALHRRRRQFGNRQSELLALFEEFIDCAERLDPAVV